MFSMLTARLPRGPLPRRGGAGVQDSSLTKRRERVGINLGSGKQHSTLAPGVGERDFLWDVWGS